MIALDDSINIKTGKKIFACEQVFDHAAKAKQMVAPFSEAVAQLEKGQYTKTPVKTQFGYHVIYLEDIRYEPMHFEKVEDKIKRILGSPKN